MSNSGSPRPSSEREEALFAAALQRPSSEQPAFLDGACHGDAPLRQRLEALLAADDNPDELLGDDAGQPAAKATMKIEFADAPDEAVGQTLGRYKLLERVGEGGCGVVYVAEQTEPVRRRVALKVIKLGMDTKQVVARFEAERQALAMMDHPNIAKVLDAGTTDVGRPFFVMELVRGIKITDYCDQANLSTKERLDLFIKVCQAIQHAHQKGIIHRDIKPSNILVTLHDGVPVPKVIDFGIAKATEGRLTDNTVYTQLHQFIGTPAYMSPEQAEMSGLDIDTRSDIYSLGVLLYELLAGSTPFDPKELMSLGIDAMRKTIREKEPQRPSTRLATLQGEDLTTTAKRRSADTSKLLHQLKGDLDWIVMKCLEKDRQRRYDTANGLAADITRHLTNEPVLARPPSTAYRFQKAFRRNKAATMATSGILAALAIGIGLAMASLVSERNAKQRELKQSVRADTAANFVDGLITDVVPVMIQQGNVSGAHRLMDTADRLAATSFSNAPSAEINLRIKLSKFANLLSDSPMLVKQNQIIQRLLPRVTDDQLSLSREELKVEALAARRFDGGPMDQLITELDDLYAELMGMSPPAKTAAMRCRFYQGWVHLAFKQWDKAEKTFAAAYDLRTRNLDSDRLSYELAANYADALALGENLVQAAEVARENLKLPSSVDFEARLGYLKVTAALANVLCMQGHFEEATQMLDKQKRLLGDRGGYEAELVQLEALRGEVQARSGNPREALAIFEPLAANRLSGRYNWESALLMASVLDDREAMQRLRRIGVLRFASTAEGVTAFGLGINLVGGVWVSWDRVDDETLSLARGLFARVTEASDWSKREAPSLAFSIARAERQYAKAVEILDGYLGKRRFTGFETESIYPAHLKLSFLFRRAELCAELGRVDEARQDFARASELFALIRKTRHGRDRGVVWQADTENAEWKGDYGAESARKETAAVFKTKGIALPPEPAAE